MTCSLWDLQRRTYHLLDIHPSSSKQMTTKVESRHPCSWILNVKRLIMLQDLSYLIAPSLFVSPIVDSGAEAQLHAGHRTRRPATLWHYNNIYDTRRQ